MKLSPNIRHHAGFTIVEILIMMGVIILLAGFAFGMTAGIQSARMKSIAKSEMALISIALSQFHTEYGDYPTTEDGESNAITLSKALLGWKIFEGRPAKLIDRSKIPYGGVKALINPSKFVYEGDLPKSTEVMPSNVRLIDPWGQAYVYAYKESKEWDNYSFVLYSKGPDKVDSPLPKDGVVNNAYKNLDNNIDNIYLED
ncbi:MAG: type II secretion system protein [Coraliomargaritaceae bacterium]